VISQEILSHFLVEVHDLTFLESWKYFKTCMGKEEKLESKTMVSLPDAKSFEKRLTTNKQQGKNYEF